MADSCATVLIVAIIAAAALCALFIVLLALPKSRLRALVLEMGGWGTAGMSTLLLISPIDLMPLLPVEDPFYLLTAVGGAVTGLLAHNERVRLESRNVSAPRADD